jgi:hypothetical protein
MHYLGQSANHLCVSVAFNQEDTIPFEKEKSLEFELLDQILNEVNNFVFVDYAELNLSNLTHELSQVYLFFLEESNRLIKFLQAQCFFSFKTLHSC